MAGQPKFHDPVTTSFLIERDLLVEAKVVAARSRRALGDLLRSAVEEIVVRANKEWSQREVPPAPDPFKSFRRK